MRTPDCTPDVSDRPAKPWDNYPLHWFRARRCWRKKYRGRHYYFESDPIRSYDAWKKLEDKLIHGEQAPQAADRKKPNFNLGHAVRAMLNHQHQRFIAEEISDVQMAKYVKELKTELLDSVSGLTRLEDFCDEQRGPALFATIRTAAIKRGLQVAERHIIYVRAMFKLISERGENYLAAAPMYGKAFEKPTQNQIEKAKLERKTKHAEDPWSIDEATTLIHNAVRRDVHLYAHLVLMAVAGYTSADVAALPLSAIDKQNGVINFPRVKNMRRRLCPLIKPLRNAIEASLAKRPRPANKSCEGLVFLSRKGTKLNLTTAKLDEAGYVLKTKRKDVINLRLRRLCESLDTAALETRKARDRKKYKPLRRFNQGQKSFRALNYRAAVGAGVHDDFIAVLRGRRFNRPIEDYYLRSELRGDLEKLALHIAKTFKIPVRPPKSPGAVLSHDPRRRHRKAAACSPSSSAAAGTG